MFHIATCGEHPPIPSRLSPDCQAFLQRCFQQAPEDRPTAEELLSDPWLKDASPTADPVQVSVCVCVCVCVCECGRQAVALIAPVIVCLSSFRVSPFTACV